jgi:hypothetical protein
MTEETPQDGLNAVKSYTLAKALFPLEDWVATEPKQGALLVKNCNLKNSHSVFIRLLSDLTVISVMSKIAGELKNRSDNGYFICYFERSGELYSWTYEELKAIIRKK